MSNRPTVIAVAIQKGGVGKTTTALNLATAIACKGHRVLLVDMDPQANSSTLMGVRAANSVYNALVAPDGALADIIVPTEVENLDLAPGHLALKGLEGALPDEMGKEMTLRERIDVLHSVGTRYDFIFIDTPPTPGLAVNLALVAADVAIIPLAVEELAVEGLGQILRTIEGARKYFNPTLKQRIALTMADAQLAHTRPIEEETRKRFGSMVFETVIPEQVEMKRPLSGGGAVVVYAPRSAGALAYQALADEVLRG